MMLSIKTFKLPDGLRGYLEFFRIRFNEKIQYRTSAIAGVITQFAFGFMQVSLYSFLMSQSGDLSLSRKDMVTYLWLQQAMFSLITIYREDGTIYEDIRSGNIVFDITKPFSVFSIWFFKNLGLRCANGLLKGIPVLIVAPLLPEPFRMGLPKDPIYLILFIISLILTIIICIILSMFQYGICIRTIHFQGIKGFYMMLLELLQGNLLPLFFYPAGLRKVLELLPTGSTQYLTNRIYFGGFSYGEVIIRILIQAVHAVILFILCRWYIERSISRVIVQGG